MGGQAVGTGIYTDKTEGGVNHSSVTYESWQERACLWYLWECLGKANLKLTYSS